ncbi:MAG: MBL fold metallo-hydrolase [Geminicoccaceae bacterium]
MRLLLLGTGCPAASSRRFGPAQLVEHGGTRLLVDCGSGVTQRLAEAGERSATLDALLVTHLHSDHVVDLWQLLVSGWHQGRKRPLRVIAPAGFAKHVAALEAAWAGERALRLSFEQRPNPDGFAFAVEEIAGGDRRRIGALEVEAVAVDHRPVEPALGFVLRAGGRTLALSGDTRPCPALAAAARDCDLLVHEVFHHPAMPPIPGVRDPATIAAVAGYHTLSTEVGRVAAEARAHSLVLTHIVPVESDPAALIAAAQADFAGPVIVGEDLLAVDLDTGHASWRGLAFAPGAS